MTALEAAMAHLDRNHGGDSLHALWTARRRENVLEALQKDILVSQPYPPWYAATCDLQGITVTDVGGSVVLVPWSSIFTPEPQEDP